MTATIIVFGNEKGGTGKSTLAVHVAVALAWQGRRVAVLDCDARQGTMSRYFANRAAFVAKGQVSGLPGPVVVNAPADPQAPEEDVLCDLENAAAHADIVVVDTPGALTPGAEAVHSRADILVTPLNDSLVDLDVLADVDPDTGAIRKPSHYAARVWAAKQARASHDGGSMDWLVLRNRLSSLDAHNKRLMADAVDALSKRIGFRVGPGFGERVIFRELFLQGLTLSDFEHSEAGLAWSMSHVAARQELRDLIDALGFGGEAPAAIAEAG